MPHLRHTDLDIFDNAVLAELLLKAGVPSPRSSSGTDAQHLSFPPIPATE